MDAASYLDSTQAIDFKNKIIRYIGKLPKKGNHSNKFEEQFDAYYEELASRHELVYYYPDKNSDTVYFLFTRIAPSLYLKKVAVAGKIILNEKNEVAYFEETFRTYKMEEDILLEKSAEMFTNLIKKQELKKYHFENTNPEEYIEFPDKYTFYDSQKREWISTRENPVEELKREYIEFQESQKGENEN